MRARSGSCGSRSVQAIASIAASCVRWLIAWIRLVIAHANCYPPARLRQCRAGSPCERSKRSDASRKATARHVRRSGDNTHGDGARVEPGPARVRYSRAARPGIVRVYSPDGLALSDVRHDDRVVACSAGRRPLGARRQRGRNGIVWFDDRGGSLGDTFGACRKMVRGTTIGAHAARDWRRGADGDGIRLGATNRGRLNLFDS